MSTRLNLETPPRWAEFLFAPRPRIGRRFEAGDLVVFAIYAATLVFAIRHHSNWADEAQAWLIARDSSLHELLLRRLHYEGAPPLWHLILWCATRLHLPYAGINWLGATFAMAGVLLLLARSPFPRIFRWLLPFTFFLQYQYAVIARPYVLVPLLLFALCAAFCADRPRPILFAVVAGLLANVSLHSAMLSGFLSLLYVDHLLRRRPGQVVRRRLAAAAAVFILFASVAFVVAFPAPDAFAGHLNIESWGPIRALQVRLIPSETMPANAPSLDPPPDIVAIPQNANIPKIVQSAIEIVILFANISCFPVARSNFLAVGVLLSLGVWLYSRRCLRLALPFLLAVLISVKIYAFDHHTGQFLLALVAAVWIALDTSQPDPRFKWATRAFAALALTAIMLQIGWTVHSIRAEMHHPYDPGRETAAFLLKTYPGKRIVGFHYESVSTEGYAPTKLFFNQPHAFWVWSKTTSIDRRRTEALLQHPDVVVVGDFTYEQESSFNQWADLMPAGKPHQEMLRFWQQNGYHVTHQFCGDRVMRLGVVTRFCEVILEPDTTASVRRLSIAK